MKIKRTAIVLTLFTTICILLTAKAALSDCEELISTHKTDKAILDYIQAQQKSEKDKQKGILKMYFEDCLDIMVR